MDAKAEALTGAQAESLLEAKAALLKAFYPTADRTQAKLETAEHSPGFLRELQSMGTLRYGEWIEGTFKYRLAGISPEGFDALLRRHLESRLNLCVYFHPRANSMFCLNLDRFQKTEENLRELARILLALLRRLEIEPLVLRSGHGYHFWCRLAAPAENARLQEFLHAVTEVSVFQAVAGGVNIARLQFICYPRPRVDDISIRLFGCRHTVSGLFSRVVASLEDGGDLLLDEEESWAAFARYREMCTVPEDVFARAEETAKRLLAVIR